MIRFRVEHLLSLQEITAWHNAGGIDNRQGMRRRTTRTTTIQGQGQVKDFSRQDAESRRRTTALQGKNLPPMKKIKKSAMSTQRGRASLDQGKTVPP